MVQVTVAAIQKLKFELFPHLVYSGDLIHVILYHSKICYMDATCIQTEAKDRSIHCFTHTHTE